MKTIFKVFTSAFLILACISVYAQCNPDALASKCNANLGPFTFLKSYKIDPTKAVNNTIEYSYVFSKDTQYLLMVCEAGESKDVVVTLYDQTRKELATNLDKKTNKVLPGIGYKCGATGVYYMSFQIKNPSACGLSVLGFQK